MRIIKKARPADAKEPTLSQRRAFKRLVKEHRWVDAVSAHGIEGDPDHVYVEFFIDSGPAHGLVAGFAITRRGAIHRTSRR